MNFVQFGQISNTFRGLTEAIGREFYIKHCVLNLPYLNIKRRIMVITHAYQMQKNGYRVHRSITPVPDHEPLNQWSMNICVPLQLNLQIVLHAAHMISALLYCRNLLVHFVKANLMAF